MNGKNRSYLMGVVGGYLIYLAYTLYQSMGDPEAGMSPAMRIVFIVFFVLAGIALMVYAVILWRKAYLAEKNQKDAPPPEENGDSLK